MAFGSLVPGMQPFQMPQMQTNGVKQQGLQFLNQALKQPNTGTSLLQKIANMQNAPINPGTPAAAGSPNYVEGGEGPMAGGMPWGESSGLTGLLSSLFSGGGGSNNNALTGLW